MLKSYFIKLKKAGTGGILEKKLLSKTSQNSQGNAFVLVSS